MPPQLILYRRMKNLNIDVYWDGGWSAQPYVLMMEFGVIVDVENERHNQAGQKQSLPDLKKGLNHAG